MPNPGDGMREVWSDEVRGSQGMSTGCNTGNPLRDLQLTVSRHSNLLENPLGSPVSSPVVSHATPQFARAVDGNS